jgi:AAA15 family ATPase/GTPase
MMDYDRRSMRVTKLRVSNFQRFADATFDLRPLNVIVGPNNSGKSTLLQAMSLLPDEIREVGDRLRNFAGV